MFTLLLLLLLRYSVYSRMQTIYAAPSLDPGPGSIDKAYIITPTRKMTRGNKPPVNM